MAAPTVADMSKDELRDLLEDLIEQKLLEILGDPDEGYELREPVRQRLERQMKAVHEGERGQPFTEVAQQFDLE